VNVAIYVEGASDQKALQALLDGPIITPASRRGVGIRFYPLGGKGTILNEVPRKAAEILKQHPNNWVFALPDLYPMGSYDDGPNRHRSEAELAALLQAKFVSRADKIGLPEGARRRFRAHCLKHDLEALLLASPEELKQRLKTNDGLRGRWRLPVEEQNDTKPPKYVVMELFRQYRKMPGYVETDDAVWILARASLAALERDCRQCFAPFVRELRAIAEGQDVGGQEAG